MYFYFQIFRNLLMSKMLFLIFQFLIYLFEGPKFSLILQCKESLIKLYLINSELLNKWGYL